MNMQLTLTCLLRQKRQDNIGGTRGPPCLSSSLCLFFFFAFVVHNFYSTMGDPSLRSCHAVAFCREKGRQFQTCTNAWLPQWHNAFTFKIPWSMRRKMGNKSTFIWILAQMYADGRDCHERTENWDVGQNRRQLNNSPILCPKSSCALLPDQWGAHVLSSCRFVLATFFRSSMTSLFNYFRLFTSCPNY